jgi:glycine/D-amino acid oxidase-like deaminating enzyme
MPQFDYAVVGAGVFGSWLARALLLRGRRVALIDQYGPASTRASSGGETRILRMGYGDKEIYTRWSWRALTLYQDFYRTTDPTLLQTTGALWLAAPEDPNARATVDTLSRCDVPHEVLDAPAIAQRFPQFQVDPATWAIFEPDAAALLARRGVQTVVADSIRRGLTYLQQPAPPTGFPQARTTIYACGPWLPKLFPDLLANRIRPTRQEVLYFGVPPGDDSFRPPAMPCWIDGAAGIYGLPDIETRGFKLAIDTHGPQVDPDTQSRLIPESTVAAARAYLSRRFPALAAAPFIHGEVCQYENTATGDYLIDRHPAHPNLWLLGGGSGHGYKHGPVIGGYVAAALEDGAPIDPIFSLASKLPYNPELRKSTI